MDKKKKIILGKLEIEIMHVVWQLEEASARQVLKEINKKKDLAYTTIITTMQKMEKKGLLVHREEERSYVYKPLIDKKEVESNMLNEFIESVFRGSYKQMVNTLVENKNLSEKELRSILNYINAENKKGKKDD